MAVGKGSIQRATRALKEDRQKEEIVAAEADAKAIADKTGEEAKVQTVDDTAKASGTVEETPAPKRRGRKPGSTAAKSKSTAKPEDTKETSEKPKRTRKTASKSTTTAKTGTRKPAAAKKAPAEEPKKKAPEAKALPDTEKAPEKKQYTQISRIKSDLPYHLL